MTLQEQLSRIKNLIYLINESQSDCDFFIDKTNIVDYDDILLDKQNRYKKNITGKIVKMTMEQYLKYCSKIQDTTYEEQLSYINRINVNTIKKNMLNGEKYSMPYIDIDDKTQEGRHRIVAATELGCTLIEVAVFDKTNDLSDNNYKLEDTNWSDVNQDEKGAYISVNIKENNIIDKLLYPYTIDDIGKNTPSLTEGFINNIKYLYELNINNPSTELISFLKYKIKNGISTINEELIYEYDILNKNKINDLLYIVDILKRESEYYLTLHNYLSKLFYSVITYQVEVNNNNHFYDDINNNYDIEFNYPILKVYVYENISEFEKNNYKNGLSYLKKIDTIIDSDNNYIDFYDFISQSKEINSELINLYLKKYPFNNK